MDFARSRAGVAERGGRFEYLAEAGSTNDELVRRATTSDAASWPDLSVIVTGNQTKGRGRLGRVWVAPAGKTLAISVLLRPATPALPIEKLAWVPLIAGLAMTRAVASVVPAAALKWPNDVLIHGRKVCGILSELLPGLDGVVVGAGVNTTLGAKELPTDTSTSLGLEAASDTEIDSDAVLAAYLTELTALYRSHISANGDPVESGLLAAVTERCETIGRAVRVELPSGERLLGEAVAIDVEGRIVVKSNTALTAVAAGDVTHLRY